MRTLALICLRRYTKICLESLMPIYHHHMDHVSRSAGRSTVQCAAYITCGAVYEELRNLPVSYVNKGKGDYAVLWSETFTPEWAPNEYRDIKIWNKVELFEDKDYAYKRYPNSQSGRDHYCDSARTGLTIVVALPREFPLEVSIELVSEFVKTHYLSQDLLVTAGIHMDEGNPHGHILISRRSIVQNEDGSITFSWLKNRNICTPSGLKLSRKVWADVANSYLEREGFEERITEKSFVDLGINLIPSKHRGWVSDKLKEMGTDSRIMQENAEIFRENKKRILSNPDIILHEISATQATFTSTQLLKTIQKRLGDDVKSIANVYEVLIGKSNYIGEGLDGMPRYTTSAYKQKEEEALNILASYLNNTNNHSVHSMKVNSYLTLHYAHMTDEQRNATLGLTQKDSLSVLLGRAGTGKTTTTVKAVCELYQQEGYTVIGGSLSKLASDNLGVETNINTKTLHTWLYCWDRYRQAEQEFLAFNNLISKEVLNQLHWYKELKQFERFALTDTSVFVLDEAGMVGTDQWKRLLEHAKLRNAKVIAVGDDVQCKAIEAGDLFREVIEQTGRNGSLFQLNTIQRQRLDWMRTASEQFATLNTQEGLALYEGKGHIHEVNADHLEGDMANAYIRYLSSPEMDEHNTPKFKSGLVLAFTNEQTHALNQAIRAELRLHNLPGHTLSPNDVLTLGKGEQAKKFALGDKIVFLKNEKQRITLISSDGEVLSNRHISNGTTGTLESVDDKGKMIVVRLDAYTTAHFSIDHYKDFSHGYALTICKSQGQTVDFTLVAASRFMDAKALYVAMTRHRHEVNLFYTKEEFDNYKAFALHMSRFTSKDLVKDYTIRSENAEAWRRVHEYQQCIYDAASVLKESQHEGDADWTAYLSIKHEQIQIGKEILNNYEAHKNYFQQAGFTQEMLEVTMGYKYRPLSVAEEKAKLTIEIYGEIAREARDLWHGIKLIPNKKEHPHYEEYQNLRDERDALAKDILAHYPLYREFVKMYAKEYGISKSTLEKQVAYREASIQKKLLADLNTPFNFIPSEKKPFTVKRNTSEQHPLPNTAHAHNQSSSTSFTPFERSTTQITHDLREHVADLAIHFLGHPKQKSRSEWRYGTKGSISIHVLGPKKGLYTNFETGQSGSAVALIADQLSLHKKEAFKWGIQWLDHISSLDTNFTPSQKRSLSISEKLNESSWKPIFPAPHDVPDLKNTPSLAYMMRGKVEVARYTYTDDEGNILGYVVRLEDKNGNKITPTLTYCQNEHGHQEWRWNSFGNDRPLYGLEQLKQKPHAPVLIVEGEKTCEAARALFPEHAVITWNGGCGAVHKTDWTSLKDRKIILFPDHDEAGLNATLNLGDLLKKQGNQSIHIVDLPSTLPHKWDLVDVTPEHVTLTELMSHTKTHNDLTFEVYQKTNPIYAKTFGVWDIQNAIKTHDLSFFDCDEKLPMACYFAKEAYSHFYKMNKINQNKLDSSRLEQKAILTGIYGAWLHQLINDLQKDKHFVEKVIMSGSLAADSKLKNEIYKEEHTRLFDAYREINEIDKKVKEHLKNPPESIKEATQEMQEGMIRNTYRFKIITGDKLPTHINKDIFKTLTHNTPNEHNSEVIQSVIDHVLEQKAHDEHPSHNLSHEMISLKINHKQLTLQHALHQSQEKSLQIDQQRNLERGVNGGIERSL